MTEHSLWRFSRALHRAINDRQFDELAAALDDEVDWAIYGPIDMFPFLGARRGSAKRNVEPRPSWLQTSIEPSCAAATQRQMLRPSPPRPCDRDSST